jgi:uncharacterized damage-inducible protein DinB
MEIIQPEQATFYLATNLPVLVFEHATTKRIIEALPADKGDYRPDPVSKTAFELAAHVAIAENAFVNGIATGAFDHNLKLPEEVKTTPEVLQWYAETFERNLSMLKERTPEQLAAPIDYRGFRLSAVLFLRFTLHHTIHHRGQLSVYLRPMGAKVPSIYGESYDVEQSRTAAQG